MTNPAMDWSLNRKGIIVVKCYRPQCGASMHFLFAGDVPVMISAYREVYVCSNWCARLLRREVRATARAAVRQDVYAVVLQWISKLIGAKL